MDAEVSVMISKRVFCQLQGHMSVTKRPTRYQALSGGMLKGKGTVLSSPSINPWLFFTSIQGAVLAAVRRYGEARKDMAKLGKVQRTRSELLVEGRKKDEKNENPSFWGVNKDFD